MQNVCSANYFASCVYCLITDHLMSDSNKTVSRNVRYRTPITVQLDIPVWGEKTMAAAAVAVAVHVPSLALCSTSFVRRRWLITAGMIGNWPLENNLLRGLPPGHTPLPQPPSSTLPPPLTIICLICASLKTRHLILMNRCLITLWLSCSITGHWTLHTFSWRKRFQKNIFKFY